MSKSFALQALVAGLCCAGLGSASANSYQFTALSTPWGASTSALAINNIGQVLGSSAIDSLGGVSHSIVWGGGTATDLNALSGSSTFKATAFNDVGDVVGRAGGRLDVNQPAMLKGSSLTVMETYGSAWGVNNSGKVVGDVDWSLGRGLTDAYVFKPGYTQLPGSSDIQTSHRVTTYAVNSAGTVVGAENGNAYVTVYEGPDNNIPVTYSNYVQRALIWNGTNMNILGDGSARDINDAGQVVGNSSAFHATLWNGGVQTDLGVIGGYKYSSADGINDAGQIVGTLWDGNRSSAFLTDLNGHMVDLNDLLDAKTKSDGWRLVGATDINDQGWVVGDAVNDLTGAKSGYVMAAVPEPETYALMLTGLGLIGWVALRRKAA